MDLRLHNIILNLVNKHFPNSITGKKKGLSQFYPRQAFVCPLDRLSMAGIATRKIFLPNCAHALPVLVREEHIQGGICHCIAAFKNLS